MEIQFLLCITYILFAFQYFYFISIDNFEEIYIFRKRDTFLIIVI